MLILNSYKFVGITFGKDILSFYILTKTILQGAGDLFSPALFCVQRYNEDPLRRPIDQGDQKP